MDSVTEGSDATASTDYDIVVVGGGVAGSFAAATAADRGADVVQLERKSEEEAGHIACGDAIKSPTDSELYPGPIDMDAIAANEDVLVDENIDQIEWWDEDLDVRKVLPYDSGSNVIDRYEFGQALLSQTAEQGVDQHFDTVVNGVLQDDQVRGVEAVRDGETVEYRADLVIDAGGSLSSVMASVDFDDLDARPETSFEEPHYQQFGSAYREILVTPEDVPYDNALVGKPLEEMGYVWYFPRTPREINVGLGFQMNKEPVELVDRLREDVRDRPEYEGAELDEVNGEPDKLGAALGLRRPLDSMVAPGYVTVGCNAGTTHPISGKGIRGAAVTGYSAGKHGAEAVLGDEDGFISEADLWDHNYFVYVEHGLGTRIASKDPYNIAASQAGMENVRAAVALLPEAEITDVVSSEGDSFGLGNVATLAAGVARNAWSLFAGGGFDQLDTSKREVVETLADFVATRRYADQLERQYENYPADRDEFFRWRDERDALDAELNERLGVSGSEAKY
ncbi:geranylgeranyl reductase family protein [Halostella sp. JP-L12]|uniref:NAD(P)/FAD-dependent oxidoreductase n=1 Tax=Halostella TaxID=1843185 RepID=UPI000EF77ED8|nr:MULTISPECIES: geranylgeranyl reductase family protein [Halostella]NHN49154.1 geranylgeranyl reductase family protein [Halostella sp. JP-L12]